MGRRSSSSVHHWHLPGRRTPWAAATTTTKGHPLRRRSRRHSRQISTDDSSRFPSCTCSFAGWSSHRTPPLPSVPRCCRKIPTMAAMPVTTTARRRKRGGQRLLTREVERTRPKQQRQDQSDGVPSTPSVAIGRPAPSRWRDTSADATRGGTAIPHALCVPWLESLVRGGVAMRTEVSYGEMMATDGGHQAFARLHCSQQTLTGRTISYDCDREIVGVSLKFYS